MIRSFPWQTFEGKKILYYLNRVTDIVDWSQKGKRMRQRRMFVSVPVCLYVYMCVCLRARPLPMLPMLLYDQSQVQVMLYNSLYWKLFITYLFLHRQWQWPDIIMHKTWLLLHRGFSQSPRHPKKIFGPKKENLLAHTYFFKWFLVTLADKQLLNSEISFNHWKLSSKIGVETVVVAYVYTRKNIYIFLFYWWNSNGEVFNV